MGDSLPVPDSASDNHAPDHAFRPSFHDRLSSLNFSRRFSGPLARCVFVGALTLFLLFPLRMVRDVVHDRSYLHIQASDNITRGWGKTQTVSGPVLIIPYQIWKERTEITRDKVNGKEIPREVVTREYHTLHKVVLPSDISFDAALNTEIRYRGIYRQALYTAPVTVAGAFVLPPEKDFHANVSRVYWDKARLSLGITDLETIAEATPVQWNGTELPGYKPGAEAGGLLGLGFHAPLAMNRQDAGQKRAFSLRLKIRGSGGIYFTPVGENTTITVNSAWPTPSFQGNLLPVERSISKEGFTAKWIISNLNRTYPQTADLDSDEYKSGDRNPSAITAFSAGVDLHEPVTLYRMVRRSVDYGILFIAVTFVALFAFEMVSRRRMHLVQYAMVGLSMTLFYLVLLSLAEHISFGLAFVAASAVTVAMNSLYVGSALQSRGRGLLMGGLLSGLYGVLFSLLRMEDFSLLMGTGLVLAMMGALMFATRNLPQEQPLCAATQ